MENKIWNIVERINFHKDKAAWEEYLIEENVSGSYADNFIKNNPERILFAYIPSELTVMEGIIWNKKYVDSVNKENHYGKLLD